MTPIVAELFCMNLMLFLILVTLTLLVNAVYRRMK